MMSLQNQVSKAIFIPAYKRPEYTEMCLESIKNSQEYPDTIFYFLDDGFNKEVFNKYKRPGDILQENESPMGLRNGIIDFIDWVKTTNIDIISKVDNDCLVPKNWFNDLVGILTKTDVDILSPNVSESQAAFKYGKDDTYELGYRPSSFVGGLWTMHTKWVKDIFFERADTKGIRGAFALLHQIIVLNETRPNIGWTDKVTFDDVGHWGGTHQQHIKSEEHAMYSTEVGRPVGWNVEAGR